MIEPSHTHKHLLIYIRKNIYICAIRHFFQVFKIAVLLWSSLQPLFFLHMYVCRIVDMKERHTLGLHGTQEIYSFLKPWICGTRNKSLVPFHRRLGSSQVLQSSVSTPINSAVQSLRLWEISTTFRSWIYRTTGSWEAFRLHLAVS